MRRFKRTKTLNFSPAVDSSSLDCFLSLFTVSNPEAVPLASLRKKDPNVRERERRIVCFGFTGRKA